MSTPLDTGRRAGGPREPGAVPAPGREPGGARGPGGSREAGAAADPAAPRETATPPGGPRRERPGAPPLSGKALTIGAVCKQLEREFPDISISKIRYLEDQKLLSPRRTQGGYRLYSPRDLARLRTILRLQRDEFLPLRVIRQELAAGRGDSETHESVPADPRALRRASVSSGGREARYSTASVVEETGADPKLIKELEDYGVIKGTREDGEVFYDDTEREIIRAATELARFGVGGRNLRVFRTSADREAALLEQILAPALRSRNPERRREAVEALENLATVASHLKHLLLVRDLRKIAH